MAEKVGIAAFSFALWKDREPNRCNKRLGYQVGRAVKLLKNLDKESVVSSQWEAALAVPNEYPVALTVHEYQYKGQYLDSKEVSRQIAEEFHRRGVTRVIVIANPFLHLFLCKREMRKLGFKIYPFKVWWIGFLPDSDQWWCKGPIRLLIYTVGKMLRFV